MAEIKVLGSSSKGNCYLLKTSSETLIIEAGLSYKKILAGLNYDLTNVVGCIISHEHGDHFASAEKLASKGVEIYASRGTLSIKNCAGKLFFNSVPEQVWFNVGSFRIYPVQTEHDCEQPFGFVIDHKEIGRMIFATDTYYFRYLIPRVNHYFIECNYQREILNANVDSGLIIPVVAKRLLTAHFELENLCNYLAKSMEGTTRNVVLLHRSGDNSDKNKMIEEVTRVVNDKNINVEFAEPEKVICINSDF